MHNNVNGLPLHPYELVTNLQLNEISGVSITFINMPLRESALPNTPPEGPAILASIVRQYGGEPYIIDLNGYRIKDNLANKRGLPNGRHLTYDEAEQMICTHLNTVGNQDVIGFSGKITTLKWQEKIAEIIKRLQYN